MNMQNTSAKKVSTRGEKTVAILVEGIPLSAHRKIKKYRLDIEERESRDFTLMEAYTEFIKEQTKRLKFKPNNTAE